MTHLSEEAVDSLLNAIPRVGGAIGIMTESQEDAVLTELKEHGYIGKLETLTREGLERVLQLKRERWGMDE